MGERRGVKSGEGPVEKAFPPMVIYFNVLELCIVVWK